MKSVIQVEQVTTGDKTLLRGYMYLGSRVSLSLNYTPQFTFFLIA